MLRDAKNKKGESGAKEMRYQRLLRGICAGYTQYQIDINPVDTQRRSDVLTTLFDGYGRQSDVLCFAGNFENDSPIVVTIFCKKT